MTRAQQVRQHVKENPGCTSAQIAAAIGWATERVATTLCMEMRRPSPMVTRRVKDTRRGAPVYEYFPAGTIEPTPEPAPEPTPEPAPRAEPAPAPIIRGTLDEQVDKLAQELSNILVDRVKHHLSEALAGLVANTPERPKLSLDDLVARFNPAPAKDRKKSVLIAGLLPNQAGMISAEFADVFDLDFYMTDDNLQHLKSKLKGKVDHFITFTSKIEHAVEHLAKVSGHAIIRCSGGMTMLKNTLLKLYVEGDTND